MIKELVYGLMVFSSAGILRAEDAFTGTWRLNIEKSTFIKGQEVKELTATVVEQGDTAVVTAKGTDADGRPISVKYTLPLKGGTITYSEGGPAEGITVVSTRVDARTIDTTGSLNGQQIRTSHAVVSPDGKTLTITRDGVDETGTAVHSTEVYGRVSAG